MIEQEPAGLTSETENKGRVYGFPAVTRNKILIYIGILIVVNIVLANSIEPFPARDLEGHIVSSNRARNAALSTLTYATAVIGCLLGLLVALLPYRDLKYHQKYLRAALLSILGIQLFWLLLRIYGLFSSWTAG